MLTEWKKSIQFLKLSYITKNTNGWKHVLYRQHITNVLENWTLTKTNLQYSLFPNCAALWEISAVKWENICKDHMHQEDTKTFPSDRSVFFILNWEIPWTLTLKGFVRRFHVKLYEWGRVLKFSSCCLSHFRSSLMLS